MDDCKTNIVNDIRSQVLRRNTANIELDLKHSQKMFREICREKDELKDTQKNDSTLKEVYTELDKHLGHHVVKCQGEIDEAFGDMKMVLFLAIHKTR